MSGGVFLQSCAVCASDDTDPQRTLCLFQALSACVHTSHILPHLKHTFNVRSGHNSLVPWKGTVVSGYSGSALAVLGWGWWRAVTAERKAVMKPPCEYTGVAKSCAGQLGTGFLCEVRCLRIVSASVLEV